MSLSNLIIATLLVVCLGRTGFSQDYRYDADPYRYSSEAARTRDALARQQLAEQRAFAQQQARVARRQAAVERNALAQYGQRLRTPPTLPATVQPAGTFWTGRKSTVDAYDARYTSYDRPLTDDALSLDPRTAKKPYRSFAVGDPRLAARPGTTCDVGHHGGYRPAAQAAAAYANQNPLGDGRYLGKGIFGQQRLFDRHQPVLNVFRYFTF